MKTRHWEVPAAVAVLAAVPFAGVLNHALVTWDDPFTIETNPLNSLPLAQFLKQSFTSAYMTAWQPLGWCYYRLLHSSFGAAPLPYLLSSLILHAANAALLYLILLELRGSKKEAVLGCAVASLLWAWHPIQSESVAWASALSDLMAAFFVLLGFLLRERGRAGSGALSFLLASLCRWKSLAYPIFVYVRDSAKGRPKAAPENKLEYPFLLVVSVGALLGNALGKSSAGLAASFRPHEISAGLLWQLSKLPLPLNLAPGAFFDGNNNPWSIPTLPCAVAITALLGVVLYFRRTHRDAVLCFGAFFLASLPPLLASSKGPIFLYDHHLYLASTALVVPFAFISSTRRWPLIAVAVLFAGLSALQTRYWSGSEALWTRVNAVHPRSQSGHLNLGAFLGSQGRYPEALLAADEQLALYPGDPLALELRSKIYAQAGSTKSDRAHLESDAAVFLFEKGDAEGALARLEKALLLSPGDPQIEANIKIAKARLGR